MIFFILLVKTVVDSIFSLLFSLVAAIVVCVWLSNIWCWVKFGGVLHSSYSILVFPVTWNEHHWNLCHFWHMVLCATWIFTVPTFVLHLFFKCDSRYSFFIQIVNDGFITCFDLYRLFLDSTRAVRVLYRLIATSKSFHWLKNIA